MPWLDNYQGRTIVQLDNCPRVTTVPGDNYPGRTTVQVGQLLQSTIWGVWDGIYMSTYPLREHEGGSPALCLLSRLGGPTYYSMHACGYTSYFTDQQTCREPKQLFQFQFQYTPRVGGGF